MVEGERERERERNEKVRGGRVRYGVCAVGYKSD